MKLIETNQLCCQALPAPLPVPDTRTNTGELPAMTFGKPILFETKHRAKFEEIDPFGHLNVNHYLSYFSENRFEGQRRMLGFYIKDLAKTPIAFHTAKIEMEFKAPVFLDDEFTILSWIDNVGTSSCQIKSELKDARGTLCATAQFAMVCVDKKTAKSAPWPEDFIGRFFEKAL
jgi:acyl-CoA thioester hydrolase